MNVLVLPMKAVLPSLLSPSVWEVVVVFPERVSGIAEDAGLAAVDATDTVAVFCSFSWMLSAAALLGTSSCRRDS